MLRRYAATSALLRSMALIGVQFRPSCKADSEWKMLRLLRGGSAEAPGPRSDVSFRLDQKTANFKAAIGSRHMQWSVLTEGKKKNELAQTEFCSIKTIITTIRGGQLPVVLRLHISVALQQKTANFKVAFASRLMQWCALTEEKQKNEFSQTEFRLIKTVIM